MQPEKRILGTVSKWFKCPSCGVRDTVDGEQVNIKLSKVNQSTKSKRDNEAYELWLIEQSS